MMAVLTAAITSTGMMIQ